MNHIKKQFIVRTLRFLFCILKSYNGIAEVCILNAFSNASSPMGSNLSFLCSKYGINFQSHYLAHCLNVATLVEQLDSQSNCLLNSYGFYYGRDATNIILMDLLGHHLFNTILLYVCFMLGTPAIYYILCSFMKYNILIFFWQYLIINKNK